MLREGLSRWLPSALGGVVQEYFEANEEDMWDEDFGVPLEDVWGELCDIRMECRWLREGREKDSKEIAALQEENKRLRGEVKRLQDGREGRKRARYGKEGAGGSDTRRERE